LVDTININVNYEDKSIDLYERIKSFTEEMLIRGKYEPVVK